MIGTVSGSQFEILKAISELHLSGENYGVDLTFGKGGMHRKRDRPEICLDLNPRFDFVKARSSTETGLVSGSVKSALFDPPFLAGGGTSGRMHFHYSSFPTMHELLDFYRETLKEALRILSPAGVLVFKCQDIANGRTQGFSHCDIYNLALKVGFYGLDLFILVNKARMKPHNMREQRHARKTHCYFWVFKKSNRRNHGNPL